MLGRPFCGKAIVLHARCRAMCCETTLGMYVYLCSISLYAIPYIRALQVYFEVKICCSVG